MADPPSPTPQAPRARSTSLVTVGSAAVLAIYAAGYWRTQAAALSQESVVRRDRIVEPAMLAPPLPSTDSAPPPLDVAATRAAATTDTAVEVPRDAAPVITTPVVDSAAASTGPATPPPVEVAPATLPPPPSTPPAAPPSAAATPAVADTATPPSQKPAIRPLKDGTFFGYGSSRHGDLEVKIEVVDRRIVHVEISRCLTRYSCNWIEALPDQVVARQTADVDIISGATVSSDCFYMAVMDAMNTSRAS